MMGGVSSGIRSVGIAYITEYMYELSRNRGSVSALSAGAYTTTLYVTADIAKGLV
jgi:hypothetical protein